jgi:hypothetical protein
MRFGVEESKLGKSMHQCRNANNAGNSCIGAFLHSLQNLYAQVPALYKTLMDTGSNLYSQKFYDATVDYFIVERDQSDGRICRRAGTFGGTAGLPDLFAFKT